MALSEVIAKEHKSIQCDSLGCKSSTLYLIGVTKPYSRDNVLHVCEACFQSIAKSAAALTKVDSIEDILGEEEATPTLVAKRPAARRR